jgi:hypothetical protein
MPSNVPAPPIEATGAPRLRTLSRLVKSAPISVPSVPIVEAPMRHWPCRLPCYSGGVVNGEKIEANPLSVPNWPSILVPSHLARWKIEPFDAVCASSAAHVRVEETAVAPQHAEEMKFAAVTGVQSSHQLPRNRTQLTSPALMDLNRMLVESSSRCQHGQPSTPTCLDGYCKGSATMKARRQDALLRLIWLRPKGTTLGTLDLVNLGKLPLIVSAT